MTAPAGRGGEGAGRRGAGAGRLLALLAAGALAATALRALAGPPRAPEWGELRRALGASELPEADAAAAAAALCWLLLGYLALAVSLRLLVLAAARASGGARWARGALRLSHLVTIPQVRRLVDSAAGGALLAASWLPLPAPGAEGPAPPAWVAAAQAPARPGAAAPEGEAAPRPHASYTVARGEHPWGVARICYGDGTRYLDLFRANCDRALPGGGAWRDPTRVAPGAVLAVPLPAPGLRLEEGVLTYRVRPGDHLWGIAERWLGDGFRWVEIWELNRDEGRGGSGAGLTDPNVLPPGLVLELPGDAAAPLPPAAAPPAPAPPSPAGRAGDAGPAGGEEPPAPVAAPRAAWLDPLRPVAVSAAGFAVVGGAVLFVRRALPAGGLRLPLPPGSGGREPGDAGLVALVAGAVEATLDEHGLGGAAALLAREGPRRIELTLACEAGDEGALLALRPELERRLGCPVGARAGSARVVLTLSFRGRPSPPLAPPPGSGPALLVPVGAEGAEIVYLGLAAAGSVSVSGEERERRRLLRSWCETLAALRPPAALALRADAGAARLLGEDASLAPFAGGAAPEPARELAAELDEIIRGREESARTGPPLVALFDLDEGEGDLPEHAMRAGPHRGVHVVRGLPAGDAGPEPTARGASIVIGGPRPGEGAENGRPPAGAIALRVGRDPELRLEPVRVRRAASPRWAEGAEAGAVAGSPGPLPASHELLPVSGAPPPPAPGRAAPGPGEAVAVPPEPLPFPDPPAPPAPDEAAFGRRANGGSRERPAGAAPPGDPPGLSPLPAAIAEGEGEGEDAGAAAPSRAAEGAPGGAAGAPSPAGRAPAAAGPARQGALFAGAELAPGPGGSAGAPEPAFTLRLLGPLELRRGAAPVGDWPREKSRELLAFLAAHGGAPVAREAVAEALWPDYPWDASLRHVLATVVSDLRGVLRRAAGDESLQPVVTARQRYQLPPDVFSVDLDAFEAALRRAASLRGADALAEYERAVALYGGDFLEGEFFSWLDGYRRDYRRRLVEAALRAAGIAEELGEGGRAERLYALVLEHEPVDERAARGRIRRLAAGGQLNEARRVYRLLEEALRRDLDDPRASPEEETRALLAGLEAEARAPAP